MAYTKVGWKNGASGGTPINAANLEHMDAQILQNANDIATLNSNTLFKLGEYATDNGIGYGTNPIGNATIELCDDINNYRFLYVASAYYATITAVYGCCFIPVSVFLKNEEYTFYTVRMSDNSVSADGFAQGANNKTINIICNSTCPMSVWGII